MKKKFLLITLLIIFILILLFGIFVQIRREGGVPYSRQEVENKLNNSLMVDYKYVSTEKYKESVSSSVRENIYTFVDENGIEFKVISSYIFWGGYELVAQKESQCNYHTVLFLANREKIESALSQHLQEDKFYLNEQELQRVINSSYHYGYRITVSDFDDLSKTADAVEAAINAIPPFSIKRQEYGRIFNGSTYISDGFDYSGIPVIGVGYKANEDNDISFMLGWADFKCVGDEPFNKEAFLSNLEKNFSKH